MVLLCFGTAVCTNSWDDTKTEANRNVSVGIIFFCAHQITRRAIYKRTEPHRVTDAPAICRTEKLFQNHWEYRQETLSIEYRLYFKYKILENP